MLNDEGIDSSRPNVSSSGFTLGLLTGGIIGAILALAFAPRAGADLRRSVGRTAKNLGASAADRYQEASSRVGEAVEQIANKARAVRADGSDAVARGADDIARLASSTKSGERPQPANTMM